MRGFDFRQTPHVRYNVSMNTVKSYFVKYLAKYMLWWYAITALLYFVAIPITIWVFPATTLHLAILILFSGFTASMGSLASALMEKDNK